MSLGRVDILVRFSPGADSYFSILLSNPLVGCRKAWFLLKDEAGAPLPVFMDGCSIPDEDINTSATIIPSIDILGPIT
jgi:hypothetical protein